MTMKSSGRFCRPYDLRQREQLLRLGPRLHAAPQRTVYVGRISGVEWIADHVLCRRVRTGVADAMPELPQVPETISRPRYRRPSQELPVFRD